MGTGSLVKPPSLATQDCANPYQAELPVGSENVNQLQKPGYTASGVPYTTRFFLFVKVRKYITVWQCPVESWQSKDPQDVTLIGPVAACAYSRPTSLKSPKDSKL